MKTGILSLLLLVAGISQLAAQTKLKSIQSTSVWAVPNVKIDGNLTEWKDDFQAYNKAVKLYYTLANDEKYLYLVVKSTDPTNNAKIAAGGITLNINTADKKNDKDAFSLTYPVVNRAGGGRGRGGFGGGRNGGAILSDSAAKAATEEAHKQFISAAKEIKVLGFKEITDTLISIYNEYSIKSLVGYDEQGNLTYEMAVPLKELGLSANDPKEFTYQLLLSGISAPTTSGFGGGGGGRSRGGRGGAGGGRNNIDYQELIAPTDFWGKYTLAKK
ncbi:hypothetical protein [Mucilaginibacter sp. UR6-11]|uniref:hypothetical protein n=1 Tax=Mucilaginibacter sp. UR6-11 TaxID=1435644 RepID=UPI001E4DD0B7|nr:hypothetical protein [Mucilaginibacter sp. UR6-11]MCC8425448.1 hypothetical protein [Mucilaginibacter sp. UR6-11]